MNQLVNRSRRWLVALSLIFGFACLWSETAWGRAGGGEHYGGGSSSGGNSSHGSGGSGGGDIGPLIDLVWLLIRLVITYPKIGVPAVIVVAIMAYLISREGRGAYVSSTIRRGAERQRSRLQEQALRDLEARDPGFTEDAFLTKVRNGFHRIQKAWSAQDLKAIRPFISDGIRERFSLQIEMQQAEGYRNQLDNVAIQEAEIVAVESDAQFDTIHVRIDASARDYDVDLETGKQQGGDNATGLFTEFWSFLRRTGARSKTAPGSFEGHCPKCGAPLDIVDRAACGSCGATVNSGEHDWVLAEITQAGEWHRPEHRPQVPGALELQTQDPAFCPQHIEDRASVIFWRLRAAEHFGEPARAAPVVTPEFASGLHQTIPEHGKRRFWKDAAVGMVELLDVQVSTGDGPDRLRSTIRWSGELSEIDATGNMRALRGKAIQTQVYVLKRQHGAQTLRESTFSSASCSQCGAPIDAVSQADCPYCGASLVDGRYEWVLEAVEPFTNALARSNIFEESGDPAPSRAADVELSLAILARMMWADGTIDERERSSLDRLGRRRGLAPGQIDAIINTAQAGDIELPTPETPQQALRFLDQLVDVSLSDGALSSGEKELLFLCAERFGLAPADVRGAIQRRTRERFQGAKKELRSSKRSR